ncbi:nitrate reductase [Aliarcobacter trophiarum LMG 25534]|uniref:Periplasmic nitrate reductase, electron transfer subunit n=1 Tax=Aliarcobacter trophiarum LMG 25534 TaxID=1032241 RepID=A0AAD0QLC7_9BACT|nr:nitrate reductase cytochrome c-type subunit [Aliarcobacter trophiarum]AXK49538.1 periplasmic nitrate reductase NapAB, small subunit, periplasmic diheme cytochrome c550 protein [Aliarcobacter trophiarum LMG 25534]RXI27535.1 nitrate reductase [Aliarcobacter trophiarum]RXJ92216.1 nitrate reductase [Aliarcobacter trophiarum LMG 25534]
MKLTKLALSLVAIATLFTFAYAANKTIKDDSIGIRQGSLFQEDNVVGDKTQYNTDAAGTSTKIDRAFENAPPMISHDTEGMLPITIDNNQCISCHDPMVAPSVNATSIPKSHFTNFREDVSIDKKGELERDGKILANSSDIKTIVKPLDHLSNARFNCSACHAPQSDSKIVPKNNFIPDFRGTDLNNKSNLMDNVSEGVK